MNTIETLLKYVVDPHLGKATRYAYSDMLITALCVRDHGGQIGTG